jgi:beta-1,4-mannosyl-glycoprotein beta-1,4-N-acetylglucosaminyltransferase
MIFDTFIYSGERALLSARLNQLNPFVDFFVIVESAVTFSGRPREIDLNFRNQILEEFGYKIRWIVLGKISGANSWQREAFQRQSISEGIIDIKKNDIILLSDVDEIPNQNFFLSLSSLGPDDVLIAQMRLLRYCSHFESKEKWHGTIATRYVEKLPDLQSLRMRAVKYWLEDDSKIVVNGGNHFTTFLTSKLFKEKIQSFSHTELDIFPFNNRSFLFLLLRLGISIDGGEILRLIREEDSSSTFSLCDSRHRYNNLRERFARSIQPRIQKLFNERVKNLSSPD